MVRTIVTSFIISVMTMVAIILYIACLPPPRISTHATDSTPSDPAIFSRAEMTMALADSFAACAPFEKLTEIQQRQLVSQASDLLTAYLDATGPEAILQLVQQWGIELRTGISADSFVERWPPPDSPDRIVAFDAVGASIQAKSDQIIGERDGVPVWQLPNMLPEAGGAQMRTSSFIDWNELAEHADPHASQQAYAIVVPTQYANGDRAIIAFWFRWNDDLQRWAPWLLRFERENRPFMGAPLF